MPCVTRRFAPFSVHPLLLHPLTALEKLVGAKERPKEGGRASERERRNVGVVSATSK